MEADDEVDGNIDNGPWSATDEEDLREAVSLEPRSMMWPGFFAGIRLTSLNVPRRSVSGGVTDGYTDKPGRRET
ncbi:MAG: hypothetical protein WBE48_19635 [Xanthobacteraceae bacterium]|jgi:hypothetical protein